MFDDLTGRLGGIFDKLNRRGALKKADVEEAMREVRVALLEADVALEIVKDFISRVTEEAVGEQVLSSITPGQMVVKIVHDHLIETLGTEDGSINLQGIPPVAILMTASIPEPSRGPSPLAARATAAAKAAAAVVATGWPWVTEADSAAS